MGTRLPVVQESVWFPPRLSRPAAAGGLRSSCKPDRRDSPGLRPMTVVAASRSFRHPSLCFFQVPVLSPCGCLRVRVWPGLTRRRDSQLSAEEIRPGALRTLLHGAKAARAEAFTHPSIGFGDDDANAALADFQMGQSLGEKVVNVPH